MEARIARLESDVVHVRTDVGDIKIDLRGLRDKVDLVDAKLSEKLEKLAEKLAETKASLETSIASAKIWVLLLLIGYGTAILGAMARGFGWI
jgi:hypothetical protein